MAYLLIEPVNLNETIVSATNISANFGSVATLTAFLGTDVTNALAGIFGGTGALFAIFKKQIATLMDGHNNQHIYISEDAYIRLENAHVEFVITKKIPGVTFIKLKIHKDDVYNYLVGKVGKKGIVK